MKDIERCRVKRILVNTGASRNILYYQCFIEMGMNDHHLKPSSMVLEGFTAHKIRVKGTLWLDVTLGTEDRTRTEEVKFYMVDLDSAYNAILGTPAHASFDLVISMSHQRVKFYIANGVGCVKSSPKTLFDFQMTSKKLLLEHTFIPMEIGIVQACRGEAESTDNEVREVIERQFLNIVSRPTDEYEEVVINL